MNSIHIQFQISEVELETTKTLPEIYDFIRLCKLQGTPHTSKDQNPGQIQHIMQLSQRLPVMLLSIVMQLTEELCSLVELHLFGLHKCGSQRELGNIQN